ncbi:MAG: M20 family peptidase [Desulfobacteraceae bacterium]|nr:MAG: M20 family peptidase [Desulfobacteraceae bacterium]
MDVITILEELIRIDSCNPFICHKTDPSKPETWKLEGNETAITAYIERKLNAAGFQVSRQLVHTDRQGRSFYNLLAEKGVGGRSLLFYGHMDTVTVRPWLSREIALTPVRGTRTINGRRIETIIGLGSNDMKAGLAAMITAFESFTPRDYKLKLAFGADEEFYSMGGNVLAKSSFMDDVAAVIVPEIADGPNALEGPRTVALGRLGRCEFNIRVPGTGGHGAQAGNTEYVNAAVECAKIVKRIEELRKSHQDKFIFAHCRGQDAQQKSHLAGSFYVNRLEAGDGTISIPSEGELSVSVSFTPNFRIHHLEQMLQRLIADMYATDELKKTMVSGQFQPVQVALRPRPTPHSEAYCLPEDHVFARFVRQSVDQAIGFRGFNMGYSVADENVFQRVRKEIPVLDIGPLGELCHRADEWVGVESVYELEKVFKKLVEDFQEYPDDN